MLVAARIVARTMGSHRHLAGSLALEDVLLLGLLLVLPSACRAKNAAAPVADTSDSAPAVMSLLTHGDDQTLSTAVSGRESFTCTSAQETEQPTERPCRRFSVVARQRGTLVIHLQWNNEHPLLLAAATADGIPITASCCNSPQELRLVAEAGASYELQVMLVTAWGHGEHQPFQLTTAWQF
jgi:hypothetical protein